ncbi:MAG: hypothetical protein H3C62_05615 [Gemmatimonadaceae bacterium]|nr:hypothetical protein [Gemmatimonadaceae bacterium]
MRLRSLLCIACALAPTGFANAQQKIDRRLPLNPTAPVKLFVATGTLRVVGWDVDSIVVTGTIASKAQFYFGGGARGAKGGVEGDGISAMADLLVKVPRRAQLWVRGGDADVVVEGVTGMLDCGSAGGRVQIQSGGNEVTAETMGGDLIVQASPAYLRLKTATGRVEWNGGAEDGAITTVSGRVTTHGAGFVRRGRIETVTGDVIYDGNIGAGGTLGIDTHAGFVELHLPKSVNATLMVSAASSDLFGLRSMSAPDRAPSSIAKELGGATSGATITVRTFTGRVTAVSP